MKYYLELQIKQFTDPNLLDQNFMKPLTISLYEIGKVYDVIPEYQFKQSEVQDLLRLNIYGKILYFKYLKISIVLDDLVKGVLVIKEFLDERQLLNNSQLIFSNNDYNLLEITGGGFMSPS